MANANPPTSSWSAGVAAGYLGIAVDPTPNLNYTVAGVVQPLPTPESQYKAIRAAQRVAITAAVDGVSPNPAPVLTSINPTTAVHGTPDIVCTFKGSGFIPTSLIKIGPTPVPTGVFVDSETMTLMLGISTLGTGTTWSFTVTNPAPGGGVSAALVFTVT